MPSIFGAPKIPLPGITHKTKPAPEPSKKPVIITTKPTPGTHTLEVVEVDDSPVKMPSSILEHGIGQSEKVVELLMAADEQLEKTGLASEIKEGVESIASSVVGEVESVASSVGNAVESAASSVGNALEAGLKDAASIAGNVASDAVGFAGSLLSSFLGPIVSGNLVPILILAGLAILVIIIILKVL